MVSVSKIDREVVAVILVLSYMIFRERRLLTRL